jgi:hypothetical protein
MTRVALSSNVDGHRNWVGHGRLPSRDPHRNAPSNWSQRYQLILYMHLAGRRVQDIAQELGYSAHRVSRIINSPLFEQRKAELLHEMRGTTLDDLLEEIRREAIPNLQALVAMRDDPGQHGGDPRLRLRAAQDIAGQIERVYPRRMPDAVEEHPVTVRIDAAMLQQMMDALAEENGHGPERGYSGLPCSSVK